MAVRSGKTFAERSRKRSGLISDLLERVSLRSDRSSTCTLLGYVTIAHLTTPRGGGSRHLRVRVDVVGAAYPHGYGSIRHEAIVELIRLCPEFAVEMLTDIGCCCARVMSRRRSGQPI